MRAVEWFRPFGLDGVVYREQLTGQLKPKHEDYLRLPTDYGIAKDIREQLGCQRCLNDLTIKKVDACTVTLSA